MYSSQFDGTGFMPSQSTQATDSGLSPAKNRETQGILPVTVKQISEASLSGDEISTFVIDGVDVTNVSLVGIVYNKAERVTDVGFTLDDGTGRIECNRWVNEAFDSKQMTDVQDEMYVRVNGRLRNYQGKRQLVAYSVRPVTNFDEIAFHFIECIHFSLQNSRMKQGGASTTQTVAFINSPVKNAYQLPPPARFSEQISSDGLKGLDQLVLGYLQQPSNFGCEKGVHSDELSIKLKLPVEKIMESIRTLEDEGLIYSTIDEFHYKSTTSG